MIERDFVRNNILDEIRELRGKLETLERTAVTALGEDLSIEGDIYYDGDLQAQRNNAVYQGYVIVPLLAPLTSTSWDGDAYSDTAKTLIDLSAVFGAPDGIKAVLMYVSVADSGADAADTYLILSPNSTALSGAVFSPMPVVDRPGRYWALVPCDANGDVYYQVEASGAGTFDVYLQIWGYAI